jgi:hypothetical protein
MSVGTRTPALVAAAVVAGVLLVGAAARSEESVSFDVGSAPSATAHILWNVPTNNITRADAAGWNSSYLTDSGQPDGVVTIVPATGVVTGQIMVTWACTGDCDGWTYRDAEVAATIVDAWVSPDGTILGTVSLEYRISAGRAEEPSDCAGSPCWICKDHFCTLATTLTGTAALTGSFDGQTLSLRYADRLEEDAHQMDLAGLTRTEFAMALFVADGVQAVAPDAISTTTTATTTTTTSAIAASDVDDAEAQSTPASDSAGFEDDGVPLSLIALAVAILLLLTLLAPGLRDWYRDLFTKMIEWVARRREPRPPPAPQKPDPNTKTYQVGDKQLTFETTVEAVPPAPPALQFEIIGSKANNYRYVEGRSDDGTTLTRLYTGSKVIVISRLEHLALVRPASGGTPIWIDRRDIRTVNPSSE